MAATNKNVPVHDHCHRRALVMLLDRVGGKWTIMIVAALSQGPLRYAELRREIADISQRMLTLSLKGLTDDGLVARTVYPTIPPRVEYELTALGFGLRASLLPLRDWAAENIDTIVAARAKAQNSFER